MSVAERWTRLVVAAMVMAGLASAEAAAEIEVHVRNCTRSGLQVKAYDAKDDARTFPASDKSFDADAKGETHLLRCHGEGHGYCKVQVHAGHGADSDRCIESSDGDQGFVRIHVESKHRADVIGFERSDDGCKPVVKTDNLAEDCNYDF